ncbi:MAG: dTDP-glucose 4,6-dehydratase [bacterium]
MKSPENFTKRIIVTGGAGFIGSNLLLHMVPRYGDYLFVNVDCLTYAGNLSNLGQIERADNYIFQRLDIRDAVAIRRCFEKYQVTGVIHLAAESHVDRSIDAPASFIESNIIGTFILLQEARRRHAEGVEIRFHHVSTDEVYGSLGETGLFAETSPYAPSSPYSASKAASDHLVRAYHKTYGLDTVVTNCSNNYGPYQFPEKLIPLMIRNAVAGKPLPVYGDGLQVRDWLYVIDHCRALDLAFHRGQTGGTYNIGGHNEITNLDLVRLICSKLDARLGGGPRQELIEFVGDRPGHDHRYAIDATYIGKTLGWHPEVTFEEGLELTVDWYLDHGEWLDRCTSGEYREYYERMYRDR